MSKWQKVKIGNFLFERQGKFDPKDQLLFTYKKIEKINFANGKIFLTDYSPTKTQQIIVRNGDFVFSGLNIEKGAVAINDLGIDLVVSTNYSTCSVDYSIIDQNFFKFLIKAPYFKTILKDNLKKDYGFTRPKHLLPLEIDLPDLNTQRKIAQKLHRIGDKYQMLSEKDNFQQSHLTLLRQQILQDAISGKLTADWRTKNPDIEPASKLLEKIKAEKEKLIAEKKIKKEKPLPKVAEDEIPFELPEKWEWCRFGEIGFSNIGVTYKPSDVSSSGVPILRSNNIQSGKIDLSSMVYIKTSVPNNKMLNIGDLLFCARNGSSRLVGKSALIKKDGFSFGAFMTKLSVLLMSAHFSFYYAQSILFFSQINDKKSTGINQLTQSTLNNMLIPIPPFTEQKAIVAKIEKLMEHVFELEEKIKQNKQDAEMLMQSFLVEAFKN